MNIFKFHRGDDKVYNLTVIDRQTGEPIPITGSTIVLTLRKTLASSIFLQKIFTLTDPVNGIAEVRIDSDDTSELSNEKQEFLFDVEATKPDGSKETLCDGKFIIFPEVTY